MNKNITTYLISKLQSAKNIYTKTQQLHLPIIKMKQTHSNNIKLITTTPTTTLTSISNTDCLITNKKHIGLSVKFADCMPIVIYHPKPYLAVIHAGRKGTEKKILQQTIIYLQQLCKSSKQFDIWFGPHICETCFEINKKTNSHYNLIKENIRQLKQQLNLTHNNLTIVQNCTKCQNNYYSYRGDNKTKKRNYLICHL